MKNSENREFVKYIILTEDGTKAVGRPNTINYSLVDDIYEASKFMTKDDAIELASVIEKLNDVKMCVKKLVSRYIVEIEND